MFDLFKNLLPGSDDEESLPEEPLSPLLAAVDAGAVDTVRQLVPTADPADLAAALCQSCEQGKLLVAQTLLETERCDTNAADEGVTPLFLAAKAVDPAIVRLLLQNGADVTLKSKAKRTDLKDPGYSPLHGVVRDLRLHQNQKDQSRFEEVIRLLLNAG
jgi:ankyrin repeat protein